MEASRPGSRGERAEANVDALTERENPAVAGLDHAIGVLKLDVGVHPLLVIVRGIGIGARGDAVNLIAVPLAAQLLAKGGTYTVRDNDPFGTYALLVYGERGEAVACKLWVGSGAGEKTRTGVLGGGDQERVKLVAR